MKRILSAFLAIAILISLIPVVSAGENDGIMIKYDLGGIIKNTPFEYANSVNSDIRRITRDLTNGFFEFDSMSTTDYSGTTNIRFRKYSSTPSYLQIAKDQSVTFNIYVPVEGAYDMTINHAFMNVFGTVSVYVNGSDVAAGSYICTDETQKQAYKRYEDAVISDALFKAGWNSVKFEATDGEGSVGTFVLSAGEAEALFVPERLEISAGTEGKVNVYSSATALQITEGLSFSSNDKDVCTVSPDGTVTGIGEGETKITVSKEGALSSQFTVKVWDAPNITVKYDVSGAITSGGFGYNSTDKVHTKPITGMTKKHTNEFFEFLPQTGEDYSGTSVLQVRQYSTENNSYIQVQKNKQITLNVYVPIESTYKMVMRHAYYKSFGKAIIYANGSSVSSGNYNCDDDNVDKAYTTYDETEITGIALNTGWNTLTFEADGGAISVGTFRLISGTGKGSVAISAKITGLATGTAEAQVLMSDGEIRDLSDSKVIWDSSDKTVATIDSEGEIKELKKGTTTISVNIILPDSTEMNASAEYEVLEDPPPRMPFPGKEYTTEYDFLSLSSDWTPKKSGDIRDIKYNYVTTKNWQWKGTGHNYEAGESTAIRYATRLRLSLPKDKWAALMIKVPTPGQYAVSLRHSVTALSAGESYIYFVPDTDIDKIEPLLTKKTFAGNTNHLGGTDGVFTEETKFLGTYQFENAGEYLIVFKNVSPLGTGGYLLPKALILEGENVLKSLSVDVEDEDRTLGYNNSTQIILTPKLADGTVLSPGEYKVHFESSDENAATVDKDGKVTAFGNGKVTITASVTVGDVTLSSDVVLNTVDNSGFKEAVLNAPKNLYVREVAVSSFFARLNSNNKAVIENITYETSGEGEIDITPDGLMTATKEGNVTVTANGTFEGNLVSDSVDISVTLHEGKKAPTYYTEDVFAAAVENAEKYDWAETIRDKAIASGDFYLEKYKPLLEQMTGEGIPRSRQLGYTGSEDYKYCRYCDSDIVGKYGSSGVGGFDTDYYNRPWKIQCPDCKRLFPSNDFEKFRELGLLENGQWSRQQALDAHRAMLIEKGLLTDNGEEAPIEDKTDAWYEYYGYGVEGGYLFNDLYSELWKEGSETRNLDPRTGDEVDGKRWGVDDGYGYFPGRMEGKVEENHCYIPYYFQSYWSRISSAVSYLTNTYVYTGEKEYARAGALLLDRVADLYPGFDLEPWNTPVRIWANTDASTPYGKIHGRINDCHTAVNYVLACDAFYPILTDEEFLRSIAEINPEKSSSGKIWENWETGILLEIWDALKTGEIKGNFGMEQEALAAAAIVLDKEPETTEILEWLYAPNTGDKNRNITGGDLSAALIDRVDRDGMGNEAAPYYNYIWLSRLYKMAEYLSKYKGEGDYRIYEHPKFAKMFSNALSLVLTEDHHAQIADSGAVAGTDFFQSEDIWISAFKYLKDTPHGKAIARYIWLRNGKTAEGLNYGILEPNPERLEEEVTALVDEDEEAKSEMLSGYGFAVLRAGENHTSASSATANNNQRDFWIYFGRNTPNASHGHSDTLNIGIEAFGLNLAPEIAYPENTGSDPQRHQWVNAPISHNTVVVDDERMQKFQSGYPRHFDSTENVKLIDVDAANAYKQTDDYRRSLVMIKVNDDVSYGIDFFRITGGNKHTYSFHALSEKATGVEGLDLVRDEVVKGEDGKDIVGSYAGPEVAFGNDPNTSLTSSTYNTLYPRGYTWMYDVRRDKTPEKSFSVDFEITDYRKTLQNGKNIHLRVTQLNEFVPSEVAITKGAVPQKKDNIGLPKGLEYMLVHREGENLDTLFTTVFEPYRGSRYIENIEALTIDGVDVKDNSVKAIKVTHTGKERADYVVYSTDNSKTYTVRDTDGSAALTFRGFVGVVSKNKDGVVIYRYVNDGDEISGATNKASSFTGTVEGFQKEISDSNYIDVVFNGEVDLSDIAGRYINVDNGGSKTSGSFNGAYLVENVIDNREIDGTVRLDIGSITLINSYKDVTNVNLGYNYDIRVGQSFVIPTSFEENFSPVFDDVSDNISTSAGSMVSVTVNAESPITENAPKITYIGTTLPRGASLDSSSGTVTWKPDASQIGENHFAITACDADGRESTVHFNITVYGSTTGSSSSDKTESTPDETPSGGGGGGGGAAPTDKPDDETNTDETDNDDESLLLEEKVPSDSEADEVENARFTDLGNHAWAEDAINTLADDGIIRGTTFDTYSPAKNITRADFASLLVRAFSLASDNKENFADVTDSDYFAPELAIARNTGLVNGIGENKFAPRSSITRQDMMVIVYRALQAFLREEGGPSNDGGRRMTDVSDSNNVASGSLSLATLDSSLPKGEPSKAENYPDFTTVAPYAQEAVSSLLSAGLVNGKSGRIAPTDYTTRAEVAVLLKRILDFTNTK